MNALDNSSPSSGHSRLYVEVADREEDVLASKRLRYAVFAQELGARLKSGAQAIDEDEFDPHCEHLLVRQRDTGRIVATTRLLTDERARRAGGFYSEGEFRIDSILALAGRRLEVGRTCVAPGYRQGAAIAVLWSGLAAYIGRHDIDYLFGCASVDLADGGIRARAIMHRLRQNGMIEAAQRVTPRLPLPAAPDYDPERIEAPLPPLLKAYLRVGALIMGEPCFDPDFNVADVLVLVNVHTMDRAYARHFLQRHPRFAPR